MKKLTYALLSVTFIVLLILIFSPSSLSISSDPCSPCHGSYYQYLDLMEGNGGNQIPAALNLSETKTVTVVIQNDVNTVRYATLMGVSVRLNSANGHFSVNNPTFNIGELPPGSTAASWQITGISEGFDYIIIQASGYNSHKSGYFLDAYTPYPLITVGQPTGTPGPPPTPAPTPISTPAPSMPSSTTPTPAPMQTPTTTSNPTASPSPSTQTELSIKLLSPSQNEKWQPQTKYNIEWEANGGTNPLNITLEYTSSNSDDGWVTIATGLPSNGKQSWTTPNVASSYYIRVTAKDSGIPAQTASAANMVEVVEGNPELPVIPILIIVPLVTISLVVVFLIRRSSVGRAKNA